MLPPERPDVTIGIRDAGHSERWCGEPERVSGYCWPVASVRDLRLAPFHVLATEGAVHADKDHQWHMTVAQKHMLG